MFDKFEWICARYEELSEAIVQPEIIADTAKYQSYLKERANLEPQAEAWRRYQALLNDLAQAQEMLADPDMADMAKEELAQLEADIPAIEREIQLMLLPKDPDADKNVVMEIRGGAGGEEAALFGTLLLLVIATVAVNMPQGYRSISSSMLQMDGDLEHSAVMLGAGRLRAVRDITIPLMRTGMVSTLLLLLMLGLREMSAILFVYTSDTRVLSILVFHSFENGSISYSASISLVFVLLIAIVAIATQVIGIREKKFKEPGH